MKYFIRYLLFKFLMFSTCVLPLRFGYWVAIRIADFGYFIADRRGRDAVRRNLQIVLPDATEERVIYETRWAFRNWGKYLCEFFRFNTFTEAYMAKHVSIVNDKNLAAAFKRGKGVMILSAHFSNWEIGAAYFSVHCGLPVNSLVVRQPSAQLEEMFTTQRASKGIKLLYTDEDPRKIFRVLKNNEMVCILGDRDPTGAGVTINFFGRPCRFPQGPSRIALATGCAVFPGIVIRRTNDNFLLSIDKEIPFPADGDKETRVREFTQNYANILEEEIRRHPEQWSAFYDVWDTEWHA